MRRRVFIGSLVAFAVIMQAAVAHRVQLLGAAPDFLMVMVLALALDYGAMTGLVAGFSGGLVIDVLFGSPVGLRTLGYALGGYMAGLGVVRGFRGIPRRMIITLSFMVLRDFFALAVLFLRSVDMEGNMLLTMLASGAHSALWMLPLQLIMKRITRIWFMERKALTAR